ncbi:MAG TPA: hypothetical protein DC049_00320 [Spirochaetia bacterium]|nr:hypothetical protein [Spirochaetia bacterium]
MLICLLFLFFLSDKLSSETTLVFPPWGHNWGIQRVNSAHLQLFLPGLAFKKPAGLAVTRFVATDLPGPEDDILVTALGIDSGIPDMIFNTSMYKLARYSVFFPQNLLAAPSDVAADSRGNIFIADTGNSRVLHLELSEGSLHLRREIRGFISPFSVEIAGDNLLAISDTDADKIVLYDFSVNMPVKTIVTEKPLALACILAEDKWNFYRENALFAVTGGGRAIAKFSLDGKIQLSVPSAGKIQYIDCDYYSQIYTPDPVICKIHKYSRKLEYITSFGSCGNKDRQFDRPLGIAVHRRFGMVFISEAGGAQYYWMGTDMLDLKAESVPGGIKFFLTLTEPADLEFVLEYPDRSEKSIFKKRFFSHQIEYFCDEKTASNALQVSITAHPTYSSRTRFVCIKKIPLPGK